MRDSINKILDGIGLFTLGIFCLFYSIFASNFAELHIQIPFLNFPIFIGEILLAFCIVLLLTRWKISKIKFNRWHYLLFVYIGFILIKAFYGYLKWGPLAFRHAALFYYPLFAGFGYAFYKRGFFSNRKKLFLILLIIFIFKFIPFCTYFVLAYFILAFALIRTYPRKIVRYTLSFLLLIVTPYESFFHTARTFLVSNVAAGIYMVVVLFFISGIKKSYRLILSVLLILVMVTGVLKMADRNAVKSMTTFRKLGEEYNKYNEFITEKKDRFKMIEIQEVKLYHPNPKPIEKVITEKEAWEEARVQIPQDPSLRSQKLSLRNLGTAYNNIFFRIFIWRDMLTQLKEESPFLGFDFGKPLRSKNIEILGWAATDWKRDGWITAHNSYLHIIYRAGIIGILFVLTILFLLFKMIKRSIQLDSMNGTLLCGILINWLVAANFLLILELPYYAIPFWSLFGITFVYLSDLEKNKLNENTDNP